ncbi:integrase, catalytic region, zinc finger, CCHC-type containing protein [Tanacetum coccineum]
MYVAARAEVMRPRESCNQIECYNCRGLGHLARNCTVRPRRRDAAYLQTQLLIAQKEEAGIQLPKLKTSIDIRESDSNEIAQAFSLSPVLVTTPEQTIGLWVIKILISNLSQAQTKQQSFIMAKVLLEKHYPPVVMHDS